MTKKRSGGIGDGRALGHCRGGLTTGKAPSSDSQPGNVMLIGNHHSVLRYF